MSIRQAFYYKKTLCLLNMILLSVPEKGLHHNSHSPGATNIWKCENTFSTGKFLPELAYVRDIFETLSFL